MSLTLIINDTHTHTSSYWPAIIETVRLHETSSFGHCISLEIRIIILIISFSLLNL